MSNNENNPPQNFGSDEGNKRRTQLKTIFKYLQNHIATASMVSEATGVPHKCLTRYKRDLEQAGRLWEVFKGHCKVTGHLAYFITTNPKFKRDDNQLNMFGDE